MNIGVLFGGKSTEHDVSVLTALFVTNALKNCEVFPILLTRENEMRTGTFQKIGDLEKMRECLLLPGGKLAKRKGKRISELTALDCVVNCCHGGAGENGDVAGMMNVIGVPVTSSDPFASRIAMNKVLTKKYLPRGISRAESIVLKKTDRDNFYKVFGFGFPIVVKPANGGSSIGISVCRTEDGLADALALAFALDEEVLVERYIESFKEINCACYRSANGLVLSKLESPGHRSDILSFDEKYMNFSKQSGDREFPAVLDAKIEKKILDTTARVYEELGMRGIVRMDYMVSGDKVYFNEINSVPGSLAFYLFEKDFSEVLAENIEEAVAQFRAEGALVRTFRSQLLAAGNAAGAKNGCKK